MKILVILSRVPYPLEKGDKLRGYYQIKELSKNNEVYLYCLSDENIHPDAPKKLAAIAKHVTIFRLSNWRIYFNVMLAFLGRKPFQVAYFYQRAAHSNIKAIIKDFKPDHIYCQLIRTTEYAKEEHHIPKTLDYQDAFSKGMDRRAAQSSGLKRYFFKAESKRLLRYENIVFEYFDHKCIISQQDRDLIYHEKRKDIAIVPNGVDFEYFKPQSCAKKFDVCFVGNMSYAPNINSAVFLAKEVVPLLLKINPKIQVLISGANPAPEILNLSSAHVTIRGWAEDIRTSYAESKIFVAPMFLGTGMQNKLLEAMAMKIPCITTKLAGSALGALANEHVIIAKTAEDFAEAINELLINSEKSSIMAENARRFVETNYSWQQSNQLLEKLMAGVQ